MMNRSTEGNYFNVDASLKREKKRSKSKLFFDELTSPVKHYFEALQAKVYIFKRDVHPAVFSFDRRERKKN